MDYRILPAQLSVLNLLFRRGSLGFFRRVWTGVPQYQLSSKFLPKYQLSAKNLAKYQLSVKISDYQLT